MKNHITVGYQVFTDKKVWVIEIRNQNTSMVLIFSVKEYVVFVSAINQQILESLFERLQANYVWRKMEKK